MSTLEAYELIRFAEAFEARLVTAEDMIVGPAGTGGREAVDGRCPEAGPRGRWRPRPRCWSTRRTCPSWRRLREEFSFQQQSLWVDALEKLHAGITFSASSRAPVIEALFPHLKFPQLRRAPQDAVNEFATAYERRLKSSYVTRIFAQDDFAIVRPVVDQVARRLRRVAREPVSRQPAPTRRPLRCAPSCLGRLGWMSPCARRGCSPRPRSFPSRTSSTPRARAKPKRRAGRGLPFGFDEPCPECRRSRPE